MNHYDVNDSYTLENIKIAPTYEERQKCMEKALDEAKKLRKELETNGCILNIIEVPANSREN